MNVVQIQQMTIDKGKFKKRKLSLAKNTLKLLSMTEEQFYENWDATAERFGFGSRGDLLAHLFAPDGDVEIVVRRRKR
jgi:hypothetical protein